MMALVWLLIAIGLAPLALGAARLARAPAQRPATLDAGSVILCALAFNLTFLWQELWLVIPKALTPGLHPVLYHNNHDWTGRAPTVELLQGTGALATFASGLAFSYGLVAARRVPVTWRLFVFWMAIEGIYQSLTQLAIGVVLPGNDVGRALVYLHVGAAPRWALLLLSIVGMALAGAWFTRRSSGGARETALTAILAIPLIIPFRMPRDLVEVALIPVFVNVTGAGWLALGASFAPPNEAPPRHSRFVGPAFALALTLLLFQIVLRPGLAF